MYTFKDSVGDYVYSPLPLLALAFATTSGLLTMLATGFSIGGVLGVIAADGVLFVLWLALRWWTVDC